MITMVSGESMSGAKDSWFGKASQFFDLSQDSSSGSSQLREGDKAGLRRWRYPAGNGHSMDISTSTNGYHGMYRWNHRHSPMGIVGEFHVYGGLSISSLDEAACTTPMGSSM